MSNVKTPRRILDLKIFLQTNLKSTQGVINSIEVDKNNMTISVLKTVKLMITHGFYKTQTKLSQIAIRVVELLYGAKGVKM